MFPAGASALLIFFSLSDTTQAAQIAADAAASQFGITTSIFRLNAVKHRRTKSPRLAMGAEQITQPRRPRESPS